MVIVPRCGASLRSHLRSEFRVLACYRSSLRRFATLAPSLGIPSSGMLSFLAAALRYARTFARNSEFWHVIVPRCGASLRSHLRSEFRVLASLVLFFGRVLEHAPAFR